MHTNTRTHTHTHTYAQTHTCTHIHAHTYTHTNMHTHSHTLDTYGDKVVWKPDGIDENEGMFIFAQKLYVHALVLGIVCICVCGCIHWLCM